MSRKKPEKDVDVLSSKDVKQITIPAGMDYDDAAEWLRKKKREGEKEVAIHHEIDCFPLDGAVALREALNEIYGFVKNIDTPGFWGDTPPVMIGVPVSEKEVKQVPWGRVAIPGISGYLQTNLNASPHPKFLIQGQTKQRHLEQINEIVALTKKKLETHSIYKGKAIRLDLSWMRERRPFDPTSHAPKFSIPTSKVKSEELVFPATVQNDIDLGLFTPIEHAEQCRSHKIPLKRGVLLAGDYGTGKTLTAYVTAKKAVDNGWTFIYLSSVLDLAQGFRFAAQYAPAVIFAEDVDRIVGQDERTEEIDQVLNAFDGVDTKNVELITVLTTNHLDKLTQAILRPGRCDTLVLVTRPDAEAAARLVKLYGRGLISDKADYDRIGAALANHLPAEIREAVERAKLAAVRRLSVAGKLPPGATIRGHVMEDDVISAQQAMVNQHKLLQPKDKDKRSLIEKAADLLGQRVAGAVAMGVDKKAAIMLNLLQSAGLDASRLLEASDALDEDYDEEEEVAFGGNGSPR